MFILENDDLQLQIDTHRAEWSLSSRYMEAAVSQARLGIIYQLGGQRYFALDDWTDCQLRPDTLIDPRHGSLNQCILKFPEDKHGLAYRLVFALPDHARFMLWRIEIEHSGVKPVWLEQLVLLSPGLSTRINLPGDRSGTKSDLAFFSNGWQSWSYSGVYAANQKIRHTHLGSLMLPMRVNLRTPHPTRRGHFTSEMFGIMGDRGSRTAMLAGFLSQQQHFGVLEADISRASPQLKMWADGDETRLDPGTNQVTDWAYLSFFDLDQPFPLAPYLEAVSAEHSLLHEVPEQAPVVGWCPWYSYYQAISEQDIRENLTAAAEHVVDFPFQVIQIDDGYQRAVGDWLAFQPTFPTGVAHLADEIRLAGFKPGLWLAPFIVDRRSELAHRNPEWLLRNRRGKTVSAGWTVWRSFAAALDLSNPQALEYTCQIVRVAAHEWGFLFLKLDHLFAGALPGRHYNPTMTRAQVLRHALVSLKEAAGDGIFLLGCGCPLGSGIGVFESMRISPDTSGSWQPTIPGLGRLLRHEPDLMGAKNASHNTLARAWMHRAWWLNDPDCLLPGTEMHLSAAEKQTTASIIALTGGSLLVSANLASLPLADLRQAASLVPLIDRPIRIPDWFDASTPARLRLDLENTTGHWQLLALFNWEDHPADLAVCPGDFGLDPQQKYQAREFWTGDLHTILPTQILQLNLPAHGAAVLALRPFTQSNPMYLGSSLHISQGLEVTCWQSAQNRIRLSLERPGQAQGEIFIYLPATSCHVQLDETPVAAQPCSDDIWSVPVDFVSASEVIITY